MGIERGFEAFSGEALAVPTTEALERAAAWARAGFAGETLVETPEGLRPLQVIEAGGLVRCAGDVWVPVEAVVRHAPDVAAAGVLIAAGALGAGLPVRDTILGPGQHLCLRDPAAIPLVGGETAMVRAADLLPLAGVSRVDLSGSGLIELVFDGYTMIDVAGLSGEAYVPTRGAMPEEAVLEAIPRLRYVPGHTGFERAFPVLGARELCAVFGKRWTTGASDATVAVLDFKARDDKSWRQAATDPGISGPSARPAASSGSSMPPITC